jgi:Domain of Unknown Function (DUF1259)
VAWRFPPRWVLPPPSTFNLLVEAKRRSREIFVLLAGEVNPVIRALRMHGIEVEAMHNHMLSDQPHLYFMHFWANDDAVKLAQGLRAALDETNSQKPQVK